MDALSDTASASRKHVYPLRMETLPLNGPSQQTKDSNIVQSTHQDLPKESDITDSPNSIITTLSPNDMVNTRNKKRNLSGSKNPNKNVVEENDEDFRFKRHKNKLGGPSLVERLDTLQNKQPPKRMENFDSSFPLHPSSQNNNINKHTPLLHDQSDLSPEASILSSAAQSNNQLNNPPLLPPNVNSQYPNQMYPMYYIPIPTSPINPQYYPSNNDNNGVENNGQQVPMIPNPSFQPFFQYPPSSQPLLQSFPPYMPSQPQMDNYSNQNNTKRSNRYSLSGNRGRRLSIVSNRGHSIIMPHSDIPTDEYYRHLTDSNVSNKLKQLFTWCAVKTYHDLNERESAIINKKIDHTKDDKNGTILSYLNSKKMTLGIVNDFINDLQHGTVDIDWNVPSDPHYKSKSQEEHENLQAQKSSKETIPGEDPVLQELFDDDDETEINKNDPDNVTYYNDGLHKKQFKKPQTKKPVLEPTNKPSKPVKRTLENLLPNPRNAENETHLKLLNETIDKLKDELKEWKEVIDNSHPDEEWNKLSELTKSHVPNTHPEAELSQEIDNIYSKLLDIQSGLPERVNKLQSHSHLYKSHTQSLIESTSHRIDVLMTEFKHKQKLKVKKPKNTRQFLLNLANARNK
ncbi:kinetochore-associated protein Dsn1p [Monosporozyma unispora]|nr:hypothetical protein C6P44_001093 [Kazachstania unispora]